MRKLLLISSLCCLFLASCATAPTPSTQAQRQSFTSVSVSNPVFAPQVGQRFAWYSPAVTWATTGPVSMNAAIEQSATQTIERELVARGYVMSQNPEDADYIIGMVITTGDHNDADTFTRYFNLSANLGNKDATQTARALIGVFDQKYWGMNPPPSNALIWKADLETQLLEDSTPTDVRLARVKTLTSQLMSSLPKGQ